MIQTTQKRAEKNKQEYAFYYLDNLFGHASYTLQNPIGTYTFQLLDWSFSLRNSLTKTQEYRNDWIGRIESKIHKPLLDVLKKPISEIKKQRIPLGLQKIKELDDQCTKRISRLPGRNTQEKLASKNKHYGVVRKFDSNLIEYEVVRRTLKSIEKNWAKSQENHQVPSWIHQAKKNPLITQLAWHKPIKANNRLRRDKKFRLIWRCFKNLQKYDSIQLKREEIGPAQIFSHVLRAIMITALIDDSSTLSPYQTTINFESLETDTAQAYCITKNEGQNTTLFELTEITTGLDGHLNFYIRASVNTKLVQSVNVQLKENESDIEINIPELDLAATIDLENNNSEKTILTLVDTIGSTLRAECNLLPLKPSQPKEPWWKPSVAPEIIDLSSKQIRVYGENHADQVTKSGFGAILETQNKQNQAIVLKGETARHASIEEQIPLYNHLQLDQITDSNIAAAIISNVAGTKLNRCKLIIPDGMTQRGCSNILFGLPYCYTPPIFIPKSAAIMATAKRFEQKNNEQADNIYVISEYAERVELNWFEKEKKDDEIIWIRHHPEITEIHKTDEIDNENTTKSLLNTIEEQLKRTNISLDNQKCLLLINPWTDLDKQGLKQFSKEWKREIEYCWISNLNLNEGVATLPHENFPWVDLMPKLSLQTEGQIFSLFQGEERVQIGQQISRRSPENFIMRKGASRLELKLIEEKGENVSQEISLIAEWDKPSLNPARVSIKTEFTYGSDEWLLFLEVQDAKPGQATGFTSLKQLTIDHESRQSKKIESRNLGPKLPPPVDWQNEDIEGAKECIEKLTKEIRDFKTFLKGTRRQQSSDTAETNKLILRICKQSKSLRGKLRKIEKRAVDIWSSDRISKVPTSIRDELKKINIIAEDIKSKIPRRLRNDVRIKKELEILQYRIVITRSRIRVFSTTEEKSILKYIDDGLNTVGKEWNASALLLARLMPEEWPEKWSQLADKLCLKISELTEKQSDEERKQVAILSLLSLVRTTGRINDNTSNALFKLINDATIKLLENTQNRWELIKFANIYLGLMTRRETMHDQYVNVCETQKHIALTESKMKDVDWRGSREASQLTENISTGQDGIDYVISAMNGTADVVTLTPIADEEPYDG